MKSITSIKKSTFKGLFLLTVAGLLSSCGSFQYADYYDDDGIYDTNGNSDVATQQDNTATSDSDKSNYYQQYFDTKGAEVEEFTEEGTIFTDVDSYTTTDSVDAQGYVVAEEGQESYGAWGTNGTEVIVNVYDNVGFGWAQPFWWRGGWGYGWNNWGWGYGFNPSWNYWAWNPGFGWGFGWGAGFGWGIPGYGFYNNGFCWYRPRFNNYYVNGVAYNRGRRVNGRDAYSAANARVNSRSSVARSNNSRRSSYSRSEVSRRINSNNAMRSSSRNANNSMSSTRNSRNSSMNSNSRNSRNSMSGSRRSSNSMNSSNRNSRNNNFNSRRSNSNVNRSSGSRMSTPRSSGSRSSGSMRSSGGSRSSGSRGGSVSRGGRGGRG